MFAERQLTSTIILFSSIHDLCVDFTLDHDQPQRR